MQAYKLRRVYQCDNAAKLEDIMDTMNYLVRKSEEWEFGEDVAALLNEIIAELEERIEELDEAEASCEYAERVDLNQWIDGRPTYNYGMNRREVGAACAAQEE